MKKRIIFIPVETISRELDYKIVLASNLLSKDNNYLYPILVKQPLNIKTAELKTNKLEFIITSKYD